MNTDDCARALLQGTLRLGSRLRHERPASALASNKTLVLAYLQRNGPSSPSAVAAAEHQQLQALTRTLAELEDDGLITRARSDTDRRASVLSITEAGRQARNEDLAQRASWLAGALGELTETEQQLLGLAARLMNQVADTNAEGRALFVPASTGPGRPRTGGRRDCGSSGRAAPGHRPGCGALRRFVPRPGWLFFSLRVIRGEYRQF